MKIYTKTGDKGKTSLLTGERVPKHHARINAYGTVDELNSFIGLLLSYDFIEHDKQILVKVQNLLFTIGSNLAMASQNEDFGLPQLSDEDILMLENEMDRMDEVLPKLNAFIIPGGNRVVAISHVCRSICRRAERLCTKLSDEEPVEDIIVVFLNRLSDYFFVLGRKIAYDKNIKVPVWDSGRDI